MQQLLIIDDDQDMCLLLSRFLKKHGYTVHIAHSGKGGMALLERHKVNLVITDFRLGDTDGDKLLQGIKTNYPQLPVIIMTGYSDIKMAVQVMRAGAYDYVAKPLLPDEILLSIRHALSDFGESAPEPVPEENTVRPSLPAPQTSGPYIFGGSPAFLQILDQVDRVAPTNYSVILYGESGSGKEVIAREIHSRSLRADRPFVAIDCGALSRELAGSELFGHEKGSFTGAFLQKTGSLELANGGTVFLDEVGNLSYDIQVSLLRVTQEREMRRIGSNKNIVLDVRIIVASNEKLWDAVQEGKFREDLYHRLNEFSIEIPPLRERRYDIPVFAAHFLKMTNKELDKHIRGFSPEVEEIFNNYAWYGNLRELKNVIKRAALLTDGEYISPVSLPFEISHYQRLQFPDTEKASLPAGPALTEASGANKLKGKGLNAEYEMIISTLQKVNFNKSEAARILNIDRKTLYNKMKQYQQLNNV
ncbi:sigma-54 dependent transcriptional regulator [Compostibacter hankyongensis]|uniref:Sigma-54 dependent transcriptional regulator n=1 Tax=Compostibacter hankyongensis TaxID=1007089 RepID=A0ABP8FP74_9BACT